MGQKVWRRCFFPRTRSHLTLSRGPHTWLLPANLEEEVEVEVDAMVRKKVPEESLRVTVKEWNRCFAEYANHSMRRIRWPVRIHNYYVLF